MITGFLLAIFIKNYLTDNTFNASIIPGIIAIFPLFAVKGNGIRDETKWRQDLKSWISSDLDKSKGRMELKRLLRGSVSPESIRFVNDNKKLCLRDIEKEIVKPSFLKMPKYEVKNDDKLIGYVQSTFGKEPRFKLKCGQTEIKKYGRISAIDLYVATKVVDDNISMEDLRDVVAVLLKYDWDYTNEKVPMFYWDN